MPHGLIPSHQSLYFFSKECESISRIHIVVPPHFPRKWDIPLSCSSEFQQDRGFFIGRNKGGQGMQALCIGEMRHGTPASLPFWNGALCTFSRSLRGIFWWGRLAIHRNWHLTFVANWLPVSRGRHLILLSWAFIYHLQDPSRYQNWYTFPIEIWWN